MCGQVITKEIDVATPHKRMSAVNAAMEDGIVPVNRLLDKALCEQANETHNLAKRYTHKNVSCVNCQMDDAIVPVKLLL